MITLTFRRKLIILFTFCVFGCVLLMWPHYSLINDIERKTKLEKINSLIKQANNAACKQPHLDIYNPEIIKFLKDVPPVDCSKSGMDWVKCRGSQCVIQEPARRKYGPIKCSFTDIIRISDFELSDGEIYDSPDYYKLERSDVVRVACQSSNHKWSATLTGIRFDNKVWDQSSWEHIKDSALKLNVLMFGYDSLSKNAFIRKLPKTFHYLTRDLNGIVLNGYNIIGDGTPQALIPILTGKTELELPDTRKRLKNTNYVNLYPFIWNEYKQAGYVTAFLEDVPSIGTFTYRLNGFKEPPTDHYMRPYYLANLGEQGKWPKWCTGDTPRHQTMLNYITDFFTVYQTKPKFLFGFHGELSHDDYNLIGMADDDTVSMISQLNDSGALNDTILIVMADHGHRFAAVRNTIQGKQEERLPFFCFVFPPWFKDKYKAAFGNFLSNADKLVTPFDIHKTLQDVLDLKHTGMADISQRDISLFTQIPEERSCAHARIEPHWCACLDWEHINITNPIVRRLAFTLTKALNNLTVSYRDLCKELQLDEVFWVMKLSPNENLLKFSHNVDKDGFEADLSARMEVTVDLYQIKASFLPGQSIFEASIKHCKQSDLLELKSSDISRINVYGKQAHCVEQDLPDLRKYCYCRYTQAS